MRHSPVNLTKTKLHRVASDSGIPHQSIDSRAVSRNIATAISDSTTHAAT